MCINSGWPFFLCLVDLLLLRTLLLYMEKKGKVKTKRVLRLAHGLGAFAGGVRGLASCFISFFRFLLQGSLHIFSSLPPNDVYGECSNKTFWHCCLVFFLSFWKEFFGAHAPNDRPTDTDKARREKKKCIDLSTTGRLWKRERERGGTNKLA